MEYGTDEYWQAIRNLVDVVAEEGKDGPFTEKGLKKDGTDVLFRIVEAIRPFGVRLVLRVEPIEPGAWDTEEFMIGDDVQDDDGEEDDG